MWGSKQASSASLAVFYITVGALIDVWTAVYYIFYVRHEGATHLTYLWVTGFFLTGLVLIIIGLAVGRIGRAARQAEVVTPPVQQITAPVPPVVAPMPTNGAVLGVVPGTVPATAVPAVPMTAPAAPAPPPVPAAPVAPRPTV
jgi:hypothetical protein